MVHAKFKPKIQTDELWSLSGSSWVQKWKDWCERLKFHGKNAALCESTYVLPIEMLADSLNNGWCMTQGNTNLDWWRFRLPWSHRGKFASSPCPSDLNLHIHDQLWLINPPNKCNWSAVFEVCAISYDGRSKHIYELIITDIHDSITEKYYLSTQRKHKAAGKMHQMRTGHITRGPHIPVQPCHTALPE